MIDRNGKGRSSFWEGSPYMDELDVDVVRPLNIKRNTGDMSTKQTIVDAMKSPVWIPHLTPTRKGDDLFISVGWGAGGRWVSTNALTTWFDYSLYISFTLFAWAGPVQGHV
jgi:hypothetical protein